MSRALPPLLAPPGPAPAPQVAHAVGGPAHGRCWQLDPDAAPRPHVHVPVGGRGSWRYRLVVYPGSGRPARDTQGRLVYVPSAVT